MEQFGQRLKRLRIAATLTQEQLAHACGYPGQSRIANYERSRRTPSLKQIDVLAGGLGVRRDELLGTTQSAVLDASWPDVIAYKVAASLGDGVIPDDYAETHKLKFRAESLRKRHLNAATLGVVRGKGDSMLPRIRDGDAILFDRADTEAHDGKLYVVSYDGNLYAKRLVLIGGRWFMESLNQAIFPKPLPIDEFKHFAVHGRVRWIGSWEE